MIKTLLFVNANKNPNETFSRIFVQGLKDSKTFIMISILLVFFLQSLRLIVAILIANYYEYVPMLTLILLGFSILIGPIIGLIDLKQTSKNAKMFLIAVILLILARIISPFIKNPSLQFLFAVIIGITSLVSISYLARIKKITRNDWAMAILVTPFIDMILKGVAYSADLIYYFDLFEFLILIIALAIFAFLAFDSYSNAEKTISKTSDVTDIFFGMNLVIGLVLFLKYFSNIGTIIFLIHSTYFVAFLLFSIITLGVFILGWLLFENTINYSKSLIIVLTVNILFIIGLIPIVLPTDLNSGIILMAYLFTFYFLIMTIVFSSKNVHSATKLTTGILIGLFLSLVLIVLQLLMNIPIMSLIYGIIIALLSIYNYYSLIKKEA